MSKLGVIGLGNMGYALTEGFVSSGMNNILACELDPGICQRAQRELEIPVTSSLRELVENVDIVLLAVKPISVQKVLEEVADLMEGKVLISIAAGVSKGDLEYFLSPRTEIVTIMPNLPVAIGQGVVLVNKTHSLSEDHFKEFQGFFKHCGALHFLDEKEFAAASVLSGCGPAFMAMVIEALGDAAVKFGLSRKEAYDIAAQTMIGTAGLRVADPQWHPGEFKDRVCSPGGTTIRGVEALEGCGMRSAFFEAFNAIIE